MSQNKKEDIKDFIMGYLHDDSQNHDTQNLVDATFEKFDDELLQNSKEVEAVLWYLISSGVVTCSREGKLASNLRR